MHEHAKQQPLRVDRDVPLAPFDLLGGVVAVRPAALRCLHALGVEDGRGRTGFAPRALAQHDDDVVAYALPHPVAEEGAHVAVDCRPRRECRTHPPRAAYRDWVEAAF